MLVVSGWYEIPLLRLRGPASYTAVTWLRPQFCGLQQARANKEQSSMVHQDQLNKIASLITALQQHVSTKIDMGLYDVGASIEVLVSQILQVTDGLSLVNKNQISVTFPAIEAC